MLSIREIYKEGYGPSSSHTIGPARAAEIMKQRHTVANYFRVSLYGSIALTGKGHYTPIAHCAKVSSQNRLILFGNPRKAFRFTLME